MATATSSYWRDANRVPIITLGVGVQVTKTFVGDSAAGIQVPLFRVTGSVLVNAIYGVCTVQFGADHTDAHFHINDQTAHDVIITKATTLTLNGISPGAMILKTGLITAVATYKTADAASMYEPTTLQTNIFTPFVVTQKTGGIRTDIEYVYTTSDAPTTGAMQFFAFYVPLSINGALAEIVT